MIGILREEVFSPNRVEDDAAILRLTAEAVRRRGYDVELTHPQDLSPETEPRMAFAMCEGLDSLKLLEEWESKLNQRESELKHREQKLGVRITEIVER